MAELRLFPANSKAIQADFSALQTAWRSRQSGANCSPPKFPGNRENNREFWIIWASKTVPFLSKLHISEETPFSGENSSREFSGTDQGIRFSYQGCVQGIFLLDKNLWNQGSY